MAVISGKVHGGQQPISGAQVYLYAANTTAYGGAPTSLLNAPGYVTTDPLGNFSFNGAYSLPTCQAAHQLVYIVAVGGNPGGGTNPNAVLMAALGDCANLSASSFVYLNEVTTVASVYALQQFMSPGTYNVGTSSTNLVGLQNAFLTVSNLSSINQTGQATTLYTGTSLPLAIDAADHIWVATIAGTAQEFTSSGSLVSSEPPLGWSIGPNQTYPMYYGNMAIAIDREGDAWIRYTISSQTTSSSASSLVEISPSGATLIGNGSIPLPDTGANSIAIDGADTVWVPNAQGGLTHFDHSGNLISSATGYQNAAVMAAVAPVYTGTLELTSLALDSSGNAWTTSNNFGFLMELVGVAAPVATPIAANLVTNNIGQRP